MNDIDITCTADLNGQICPYPVMQIVREVDMMSKGETASFLVDDPLAIKAVPEEFEDYGDISIEIETIDSGWRIIISRHE